MNIKILQWNLGGSKIRGDSKDLTFFNTEGVSYVKSLLSDLNPDIAFFQELHFSKKTNQLNEYAKTLGHRYSSCVILEPVSHLDKSSGWGIGISSKFPIISSETKIFKNPNLTISPKPGVTYKSFNYGVIYLNLLINKKMYTFGCLHLLSFRVFKLDLDSDIANIVFDSVNKSVEQNFDLVCGDFNVPQGNPEKYIKNLNKYRKVELLKDTKLSGGKSDCIFYSRNLKLDKSELYDKDTQTDHFPVVCEFEVVD